MICAWTETSREAIGSSRTIRSGSAASARAMLDALALTAGEFVRIPSRESPARARPDPAVRPTRRRRSARSGEHRCTSSGSATLSHRWCAADRARRTGPGRPSRPGGAARAPAPARQPVRPRRRAWTARPWASTRRSSARPMVDLPTPTPPPGPASRRARSAKDTSVHRLHPRPRTSLAADPGTGRTTSVRPAAVRTVTVVLRPARTCARLFTGSPFTGPPRQNVRAKWPVPDLGQRRHLVSHRGSP